MKFDDNEIRQKIRKKLIHCRREAGATQAEVGKAVGKSPTAVASWEQGYSLPDIETYLKLTKFYDKPIEYMFDLDAEGDS